MIDSVLLRRSVLNLNMPFTTIHQSYIFFLSSNDVLGLLATVQATISKNPGSTNFPFSLKSRTLRLVRGISCPSLFTKILTGGSERAGTTWSTAFLILETESKINLDAFSRSSWLIPINILLTTGSTWTAELPLPSTTTSCTWGLLMTEIRSSAASCRASFSFSAFSSSDSISVSPSQLGSIETSSSPNILARAALAASACFTNGFPTGDLKLVLST